MSYATRRLFGMAGTPLVFRDGGYLVHPLVAATSDADGVARIVAALGPLTAPAVASGTTPAAILSGPLKFATAPFNPSVTVPINGKSTQLFLTQYNTFTDGTTEYALSEVQAFVAPPPPPPPALINVPPGPPPMAPDLPVVPQVEVAPAVPGLVPPAPVPLPVDPTTIAVATTPAVPTWAWLAGGAALLLLLGGRRRA